MTDQPWGIFFVKFEPKRLPVVALRRVLRSLVIRKRRSADQAQTASWQLHDLLFISAYGEDDQRQITFAHFSEDPEFGDLPTLRVLGWDDADTVLHIDHVHQTLHDQLSWPDDHEDLDAWRERWASAFTVRHREVITTSRQLAERLAELARVIRRRVNAALAVEAEDGPTRTLMAAFKEALIHDLSEDDFADMYAQTIAYGLLSARVSRPAGLVADDVKAMVPITNPFLRDLLDTFLDVGGRQGAIDFDELGVNDVVELLRRANMEAVLRDFGDRNPQEDPVIHFYEAFLREYDAEKRMKRGVFYTPRPVVSYIVPILQVLHDAGGSAHLDDVKEAPERMLGDRLGPADRALVGKGEVRWIDRAQWVRYAMVVGGLLRDDSPRATWEITAKGEELLRSGKAAEAWSELSGAKRGRRRT